MKIAIFGGSFDPPHLGHDSIVKTALKILDIDKLFIVPAWQNPLKESTKAPSKLRLKWVKKLWANLEKVEILDYEINQNQAIRSIQTVRYIKEKYKVKNCYFLIGADNAISLDKWYKIEELKKECEFIVATRRGEKVPKDLKKIYINVNISSSKIRDEIAKDFIPLSIKEEVISFYQGKQ